MCVSYHKRVKCHTEAVLFSNVADEETDFKMEVSKILQLVSHGNKTANLQNSLDCVSSLDLGHQLFHY